METARKEGGGATITALRGEGKRVRESLRRGGGEGERVRESLRGRERKLGGGGGGEAEGSCGLGRLRAAHVTACLTQ